MLLPARRRSALTGVLLALGCGVAACQGFQCGSSREGAPRFGPPAPACARWAIEAAPGPVARFAVIGDFGASGAAEQSVADLVKRWRPDFILTTGDNNYPRGEAETIDANIGAFYHEFIGPYLGRFGCGADRNRFFPALGNHDWYTDKAAAHLAYFTLPGNERYYDQVWGAVHVFAVDSDEREPDGTDAGSLQAAWLRQRLAASTARWKIVYMHHPPYSSGPHGPSPQMRWPFAEWGADLVLAGHDHIYERLAVDGIPYVVDGLGGATFYALGPPLPESQVRFTDAGGALLVEADAATLHARFVTTDDRVIDDWTLPAR
ncbi:MAG TPA: metallophosphoesterase [Polyangia bacterium]|nr:metallophosphoesterase [Polyangia bacterium]